VGGGRGSGPWWVAVTLAGLAANSARVAVRRVAQLRG